MRDELERQGWAHDVVVAVVTFDGADRLAAHRRHLGISFPMLHDADRAAYRAYGLDRGTRRRIYRPATILRYVRLRRAGRQIRRPMGDTRQLGGDFVVGPDGRLRFAFRPVAPDDRPPVTSIVAALDPLDRA